MKIRSSYPLLVLFYLLLCYECGNKTKENTATDISSDLIEERLLELESRENELEPRTKRIEEEFLTTKLQIDGAVLPETTEAIATEPDWAYGKINAFIESGSFTVRDDIVNYSGDTILDFGPNLKISSVDGSSCLA